ncbi:hypothetical protein [Senegalia massiliensis]|jgi:hypothetical protein|uniref:hypothetical protein n=1 Tax=Senegalia massiliensis TaxID=1720316 RepID=UPI001031E1BC|nr:hypothetical protein [Senegalia massiliensis]
MNKNFIIALKVIGPTIIGIIFSFITYKILDVSFFNGEEGRELIISYAAIFAILPIASIFSGMISKVFLNKLWVSLFNVIGIWLVLFAVAGWSIFVLPFLPLYMICGFFGALLLA